MDKKRVFEILNYTYGDFRDYLSEIFHQSYDVIEEIRIRADRPVVIRTSDSYIELKRRDGAPYVMTAGQIEAVFNNICENSRYAYMNEICKGFVTLSGGHRVGIAGRVACENGKIHNFTDISSLNIRVASERIGVGDGALPYIVKGGNVESSLIFAPPMVGKTTVLRDIARQISNMGFKVGITDDRGELAGMYRGSPQNDIGKFTDVIENAPKYEAITMLIRSMSPDVIITDEIATERDADAVLTAVGTGVKVIATTHGSTPAEVINKSVIKPLAESGEFSQMLGLNRCGNILSISRYRINADTLDVEDNYD